jgi:transposase-like protein
MCKASWTHKVKAITEELCGHRFSASSISAINQRLDASLAQYAGRALAEAFPYLIGDAATNGCARPASSSAGRC